MENETIGSMKNESTELNNNFYLGSKSLLTAGCIGAACFGAAALLYPVNEKIAFAVACLSTFAISTVGISKRAKALAARNKERIQQMGQESIRQQNRTLKQLLAEDDKTMTSAYSGANVLAEVLIGCQIFAWFSKWHISPVCVLVVMLTLSIYTMFAGRVLGNKYITYLGFLPAITGIVCFDEDIIFLLWNTAAAYLISLVIPSLFMMLKKKKN